MPSERKRKPPIRLTHAEDLRLLAEYQALPRHPKGEIGSPWRRKRDLSRPGNNVRQGALAALCRRFGVSPQYIYRLVGRV